MALQTGELWGEITPFMIRVPGNNTGGHWYPGKGKQPKIYLPKKFGFFNQEVLLSAISERLKSIVKDNVD